MSPLGMQAGVRQILPVLAVWTGILCNVTFAQSGQPVNEGGSNESEPHVILSDNKAGIPVRVAANSVQDSTDPLVKLVWDTRESTRQRLLSTKDHTPWQIMHGLLGLRQDFLISHQGKPVSGLEWIQSGPSYQNEPWFEKTQFGGRAHPFSKPYWFEGHVNQFLAILATCNLPLETTFQTASGPVTMKDMLRNAQMTVNSREEVTWTLWALATYLPSDATWVNAAGEQWSIEKLVQIETGKKVGGPTSPCGGTHGLFALARARNVYLRTGKPLRGAWFEADQKIKKYIEVARVLRNSDGSLTSGFFKTREYKQDFDKRMASEGHLLEFLMMSVSQQQLREPWVRGAIETTARDLMSNRREYVSCSPLYHATNALSIYLDRVTQEIPDKVAEKPPATKSAALSKESPLTSKPTPGVPGPMPPKPAVTTPAAAAPAATVSEPPKPTLQKPVVPQPQPTAVPAQPATEATTPATPSPTPPQTPAATSQPGAIPEPTPQQKSAAPATDNTPSPATSIPQQPTAAASASPGPAISKSKPTSPAILPGTPAVPTPQSTPDINQQNVTPTQSESGRAPTSLPSPLKSAPVTLPTLPPAATAAQSALPSAASNPVPRLNPSPATLIPATEQGRATSQVPGAATTVPRPGSLQVAPLQPKPAATDATEIISLGDFLGGKSVDSPPASRSTESLRVSPAAKSNPLRLLPVSPVTTPQGHPPTQDKTPPPTNSQEPAGTIKRPLKSGNPAGRGAVPIWQNREGRVTPASANEFPGEPSDGSSKVIGMILQMSGSEPASRRQSQR